MNSDRFHIHLQSEPLSIQVKFFFIFIRFPPLFQAIQAKPAWQQKREKPMNNSQNPKDRPYRLSIPAIYRAMETTFSGVPVLLDPKCSHRLQGDIHPRKGKTFYAFLKGTAKKRFLLKTFAARGNCVCLIRHNRRRLLMIRIHFVFPLPYTSQITGESKNERRKKQ